MINVSADGDHHFLPKTENLKKFLYHKAAWDHYETFRKIERPMVRQLRHMQLMKTRHKLRQRKRKIEDALVAAKGKTYMFPSFLTQINRGLLTTFHHWPPNLKLLAIIKLPNMTRYSISIHVRSCAIILCVKTTTFSKSNFCFFQSITRTVMRLDQQRA